MSRSKALISGLAGALALTAANQGLQKYTTKSPKVDLFGMKVLKKGLQAVGLASPGKKKLFGLSLGSDLLFNSIYYSMTASGKTPLVSGSLLGLGAGAGTLSLPGLLGFGKEFVGSTFKQRLLSMGIYFAGGLTAAATYKLLNR
ncbi:hypothetical protein MYP_201 [Sporocytophaga myxococcoides]|uniref:Uncharacterized protein n=1 Tax=Sporocytophaga myxococcoides TaxID=153721 RepID=A0A098L8D7_9BACT|nr:hypothetical protein [Sporocytophaga myxococcoides]GAL82975.1 hypothetical protein MYP_201 [Sporocytophaga myxococcoides]